MKKYTDVNGRKYALVSEVGPGDVLIADGGFISDDPSDPNNNNFFCIDKGSENLVHEASGDLYVNCKCGEHKLDGQYEKKSGYFPFYMGFYLKK